MAAYLALAAHRPSNGYTPTGQRPAGALVWGHAPAAEEAHALAHLFGRLRQLRGDVSFLLTYDEGVALPADIVAHFAVEAVPPENRDAIVLFLDHWRPDVCIWARGALRPALIDAASDAGTAMYLVNAQHQAFDFRGLRWLPDLVRRSLGAFDMIFALDTTARNRLLRLGVVPDAISVSGPLEEGGSALPCDQGTHEKLVGVLQGRPTWLAAMLQPDELPVVTEAHRAALSLAHRLLLVIAPDNAIDEPGFAAALDDEGWRVARWSRGELPGETTQILLADSSDEMGLWYRVAPVSFMGSSVVTGAGGRDPYGPAALGSAVLYGPNVGRYLGAYSRLAAAGAARIVKDAGTLSAAVTRLSAPAHAAEMAHAAWSVASQGAEVTDQLLALIEDTLDLLEVGE
ncbi:3-deoxy-D-manno-octulosonic acid transferase [Lutimaribacter sp. EGI FJ00013]|uniref:3-deoxy-D-manno-octulosonic acid transferase n=1 Tax=Lutimaribacter degradans TaxID=2945989 RepID=A0ACC5ZTV6_9RHOB|nr:glycosyltransferase N-terminal domain-containing protein [Lutimaribacter sp. EGI FJ00013]MCM2561761.1 3-deoxy-D-manno-octulosonic acid transferase [Lutimaribacter sp. EGI FJ00013]